MIRNCRFNLASRTLSKKCHRRRSWRGKISKRSKR